MKSIINRIAKLIEHNKQTNQTQTNIKPQTRQHNINKRDRQHNTEHHFKRMTIKKKKKLSYPWGTNLTLHYPVLMNKSTKLRHKHHPKRIRQLPHPTHQKGQRSLMNISLKRRISPWTEIS